MASPLQTSIDFLESFGFFDIVLPFILVFTLVFAILEKTRILGEEDKHPKRNLNALVAFVIGLFVVAATSIVNVLRDSLPVITLILVVLLCFMLLVGAFHGEKEFTFAESKGWKIFLTLVMFISVLLVFGNFIKTDSGESWLEVVWDFAKGDLGSGPVVSSVIFLAVIIFVVWFVGWGGKKGGGE
ncbi:MAG: hypothetical protein ABIB47_05930 [Candidatus Woesearchaeota archaeon]